ALRIKRVIEFLKVPTKALIGTGTRKRGSARIIRRTWHETLWCAVQPAKHEERMLAGGIPSFCHAGEGRRADSLRRALSVADKSHSSWATPCQVSMRSRRWPSSASNNAATSKSIGAFLGAVTCAH